MSRLAALPLRRVLGVLLILVVASCSIVLLRTEYGSQMLKYAKDTVKAKPATTEPPRPKYKPTPAYRPPPITDPFPLLATSTPPPIPKWNQPRENLSQGYDLPVPPPLLIGFTRSWPILLQAVVSYITAGWPPSQIFVIENTGVHNSNAQGKLTLQNPFFLNHTILHMLGVNIVQTPVLLSFAQLQNFYLSMSYDNGWPYYFWSHMDVLALSYEEGKKDKTAKYDDPDYKTIYELCVSTLAEARKKEDGIDGRPRWGLRFFAYDHLALVNPAAYEDIGGWDTLIPYYITDCDMHSRVRMANWSIEDGRAGIVADVSVVLDDLAVLYRIPGIHPSFTDPNPPPPKEGDGKDKRMSKRDDVEKANTKSDEKGDANDDENLDAWRALLREAEAMSHYKHGDRGRNTWQTGQRGGQGEPYHYDAAGLAEALEVITEAGKEVYRRKWGHRDCDLITGAGLKIDDQWQVEKDWRRRKA